MELTKNCTGCMACYNKCPSNAIKVVYSKEGFYLPKIDDNKCTNCGLCNSVCPQIQSPLQKEEPCVCYAVMADDEIRKNSASGGLFATIAEEYLKNGSYVCGAAFSDDFRHVNHIVIDKKEDLIKLQNSKYVQSNIGRVFSEIKKLLDNNKEVLFCSTPCQVAGLNNYLGKKYDNLLTMDLVCHGIPSPLVWEKYLGEISNGKKIKNILFRNKKNGWHYKSEVEILLNNRSIKDNLFYRGFFEHLILNEACYDCKYTNLQRPADITIGDFWGIEYKDSDMNDEKGTSLLIINTQKGQNIIDKYKNKFKKFKEFDINDAITGNQRLKFPSEKNFDNTQFVYGLTTEPLLKNLKNSLCPKYEGVIKNFWACANFGATLSAYALQQYLQEKGKNYYLLKTYQPEGYTKAFADKYLKTTHLVTSKTQYKELNKCTDNFIIGTDQVLRPLIIEYNLATDLLGYTDFNKNRISFSGSFGMMYLENMCFVNKIKYKKLIKRFTSVSTREVSGVDICKHEFNMNAECIIDPVFLIDKEKWLKIAPNTQDKYKNKIVCYMLRVNNDKLEKLQEFLTRKYNKEVIMLVNSELPIDEFLSAIKDADAVVTNSFHGTCFSLIFNKKVLGITNSDCGDSRFDSLIKLFDIEQLTVKNLEDIYNRKDLFVECDFNKFLTVLNKERKKAEVWFDKVFNQKKQVTLKNIFAEIDYKAFSLMENILRFIINKYINLKFLLICRYTHKKVVLWGASLYLANLLKENTKMPNNILGIIDSNSALHYKEFYGCTVYPPEKITELKPNIVISTVKNNHINVYREITDFVKKNCPSATILPDIFEG